MTDAHRALEFRGTIVAAMRLVTLLLLLFALSSAAIARADVAPVTEGQELSPTTIFSKACDRWADTVYPDVLAYDVIVKGRLGEAITKNTFHVVLEPHTGKLHVASLSDEEQANPHVPRGIDVRFNGVTQLNKPEKTTNLLGVPYLAPNYSFGLARELKLRNWERLPNSDDTPVIARVNAHVPAYVVTLAGIESGSTGRVYHLKLEPKRDPFRYRLRDLWVNLVTFETVRARVEGNFTGRSLDRIAWLIDFVSVGGRSYISSEVAEGGTRLNDGRYVTDLAVTFSSITENPPWKPGTVLLWQPTPDDALREPET